jgi:hypothetical protein
LDRCYGKSNAGQSELALVRGVFTDSGAKRFAESEIARLSAKGRARADGDALAETARRLLDGLITYLIGREL